MNHKIDTELEIKDFILSCHASFLSRHGDLLDSSVTCEISGTLAKEEKQTRLDPGDPAYVDDLSVEIVEGDNRFDVTGYLTKETIESVESELLIEASEYKYSKMEYLREQA